MKNRLFLCILIALISLSLAGCDTGSSISTEPETSVSISTEPVISVSVSTEPEVSVSVSEETQVSTETGAEQEGRDIVLIFANGSAEKLTLAIMNPADNAQITLEPAISIGESIRYDLKNWLYTDEVLLFAVYNSSGECVQINQISMTDITQGIMVTLTGETKYEGFSLYYE